MDEKEQPGALTEQQVNEHVKALEAKGKDMVDFLDKVSGGAVSQELKVAKVKLEQAILNGSEHLLGLLKR